MNGAATTYTGDGSSGLYIWGSSLNWLNLLLAISPLLLLVSLGLLMYCLVDALVQALSLSRIPEKLQVSGNTHAIGDARILTTTHRKYTLLNCWCRYSCSNLDATNW